MKDKMVYKGNNVIGALMNVPIFVGTFSILTDFAVLENMDDYRDEGMGDVIFGEPFLEMLGLMQNDKWSHDELAYVVPTDGPYQTNPPSPDDIISFIRNYREGQVTRIRHEEEINSPELSNECYVLCDHVMNPLTAYQEQKTRKDHGTRRGRHSTSSSSAFDQPSSSYINDDNDGNDEGTSCASTPSPTRFVNSLKNDVP
ncbi:hypothetical protein Tco_0613341 [Tanacetum coccineum]